MRSVTPSMQAKLDAPVSTLCNCWRLARRDGVVMGFTDHDRDLTFGDVVFRADSGLSATQAEASLGLSIGSGEALGALRSEGVREADLVNGVYDGASVEIWLVDWSDVNDRLLIDAATIGEVRRSEFAFTAELRSLAHLFDQPRGDSFQRVCSADLGDARCKVDLTASGFRGAGAALSSSGDSFVASLSEDFDEDFFTGGRLHFTTGANAGARATIKSHRRVGETASLALWAPLAAAIAPGDEFTLAAGCDKSAGTCRTKFANLVNFRGFPHMPGNDLVIAYPSAAAPAMDGGSLFR
ncbi:DUF2163 domain-containing protein [Methylosinus sp. Sm6]|uniref:DUF2163 domain-containing protein n=1 Tax=Methylosinus sp. Sm6 TaxID=2866948 RepID=UPI001C993CFD|nr:DUF2163 domain-containing protein [Methylosinus sp. Sm6]MBY6239756.1 DUF2163 domain-containing protein [Methylosinus sp. Sm6]